MSKCIDCEGAYLLARLNKLCELCAYCLDSLAWQPGAFDDGHEVKLKRAIVWAVLEWQAKACDKLVCET